MKFVGDKTSANADIITAMTTAITEVFGAPIEIYSEITSFTKTYKVAITSSIYLVYRFRTTTAGASKLFFDAALTTAPTIVGTPGGTANSLPDWLPSYIKTVNFSFGTPASTGKQTIVICANADALSIYVGGEWATISKDFITGTLKQGFSGGEGAGFNDYYVANQMYPIQYDSTSGFLKEQWGIYADDGSLVSKDDAGLFLMKKDKSGVITTGALVSSDDKLVSKTYSNTFNALIPLKTPVFISGKLVKIVDYLLIAATFEANLSIGQSYYIGADEYVAVPCMLWKVS